MSGLRRLIAVGQAWLLVLLAITLGLAGAPGSACAHEMSMAEM